MGISHFDQNGPPYVSHDNQMIWKVGGTISPLSLNHAKLKWKSVQLPSSFWLLESPEQKFLEACGSGFVHTLQTDHPCNRINPT